MSGAGLLLTAALLLPLAMAAACLNGRVRARMPSLLVVAPLPALLAALLLPDGAAVHFASPLRMTLALDRPGATLLGGAALLWSAAGAYASSYLGGKPGCQGFAVWWLLTLAGSLGLFIVADVIGFYLLFSLASLSAYGLIVHERSLRAQKAAGVYMVLALLGEAFLLIGLVLLAAGHAEPNPLIREAVAALPGSPLRNAATGLLVTGFALKMGLVPVHVWLPLAHPAAPMPASAVLSGVLVKAGVIGLIRFLPFGIPLPGWGETLVAAGLVTAYAGVAIGITQTRPKTILAYSTVSQMGLVAAIAGAGLAAGERSAAELTAYYGVHHTLVKGALFLAVGVVAATGRAGLRPVLAVTAMLALALGGLPLTSGALAKLAAKPLFGDGTLSLAISLAGAGSTLLMLHFIAVLSQEHAADGEARAPLAERSAWLAVAAGSLLIPWWLFAPVTGLPALYSVMPDSLWKLLCPMALGAAAWLVLRRLPALRGAIPEGDLLVLAEKALPLLEKAELLLIRGEATLRHWPVAGCVLVGLALLLGALSL